MLKRILTLVLIFGFLLYLFGRASAWQDLAEAYPSRGDLDGEYVWGTSRVFSLSYRGGEGYQGIVKQEVSNDGVHLSLPFPLSLLRSSVWVPNDAISVCGPNKILVQSAYTEVWVDRRLAIEAWCERQGIPVVGYNEFQKRYYDGKAVDFDALGAFWDAEGLVRAFPARKNTCRQVRFLIGPSGYTARIGFINNVDQFSDDELAGTHWVQDFQFRPSESNPERVPVKTAATFAFFTGEPDDSATATFIDECLGR